jgi:polysaccharide export outer membrane protein
MTFLFKQLLGVFALLLVLLPTAQGAKQDYLLGPGDVIRVSVYDHPDLAAEPRVSQAGTIQFPLLGEVQVRGRTANEAADQLAKLMSEGGFVKQPQVSIIVTQFRSQQISVLGYVAKPGKYPVEQASNVADMIALVGGTLQTGSDIAILIRQQDNKMTRQELDLAALFEQADATQNPAVSNGDVIYVPREPRFYIYGEAQRAGSYRLERNMTVMQALSVAGGLTLRGTESRIKINRRDAKGAVQTISVKLDDPVRPDDVIYISESLF